MARISGEGVTKMRKIAKTYMSYDNVSFAYHDLVVVCGDQRYNLCYKIKTFQSSFWPSVNTRKEKPF